MKVMGAHDFNRKPLSDPGWTQEIPACHCPVLLLLSISCAASLELGAELVTQAREERGRRRQPTPYFLRLHRGITAGKLSE